MLDGGVNCVGCVLGFPAVTIGAKNTGGRLKKNVGNIL